MDNFITARAKIVYDGYHGTKDFQPYWMRAMTSTDFKRLYAYFMFKKGVRLDIGSQYGCHISVIKGEKPKHPELWKYMDKQWIEFKYEPCPYSDNNKHVWINVYSDELIHIREKLGLPFRPKSHITIGRFY
jgi:hypothetical protein